MVEETLTDTERRRLVNLAIAAVPRTHGDPELTSIIAKLSGVDTEVVVKRAYHSTVPKRYELDGETIDLAEFVRVNEFDEDEKSHIRRLSPGEEMAFGGGAMPITVLRRVS